MGQVDVYLFLKKCRQLGDNSFYSVKQVEEALRNLGFTNGVLQGVRGDLTKLTVMGYLDTQNARGLSEWPGRFRLKRKHVFK